MDEFNRELGSAMRFVLDLVSGDPDATYASIYVEVKDGSVSASATADFLDGTHSMQTITVSPRVGGEDA